MTNGVIDITIKDKTHRIRFNGPAGLLFQTYMASLSAKAGSNESNIIMLLDLFYCGFYGEAVRLKNPIPSYESIADLFDEFMTSPNFNEDSNTMWRVWTESVVGSEMLRDVKKKEPESQL